MIAVIIPVFNKPNNLVKCLAAVTQQTFKDIEVIVVDDGSQDPIAIENVVKQFPVDKFIHQENKGAPVARNVGFAKSTAEYVIFLDSDAVMDKNMLEKMHQVLNADPNLAFVYSSFKHGSHIMTAQEFDLVALEKLNYIHTASLLRRKYFPGFDESLKKFQDWDLWLTIAKKGGNGQVINEVLFQVIDTKGTMSSWLPKFIYKLPWPIFGFTPLVLQKYFTAQAIIKQKHNLS